VIPKTAYDGWQWLSICFTAKGAEGMMSEDIQELWRELLDLESEAVLWQAMVILLGLFLAWIINGLVRRNIMSKAPEAWTIEIGGFSRVLFPLVALALISSGKQLLHHWQHTGLISLAVTLLIAMAIIRLAVYTLRYIFSPSGWLHTAESTIVATVWLLVALHFSGLLPELLDTLENIGFPIGKHRISLLLIVQALLTVILSLVAVMWVSRLAENKVMHADRINMNLRVVLTKLIRISLIIIGVLAALSAVGFDITLLSVFGGALGVGLGFGLQKIASNYVSGFIILLDESLHLGDVITVDNHYGVVHQLRARYLVLRKLDGTEVVIPNETLIASTVINHSFSDRKTRIMVPVQVGYESPLEQAMELMLETARKQPRILADPVPEVLVHGFGENGIDLQLSIWINDPEEGSSGLQSQLYIEMRRSFRQHGISIPYPQREVRIVGAGNEN
jgi:small-conductance mechanosensitive channel